MPCGETCTKAQPQRRSSGMAEARPDPSVKTMLPQPVGGELQSPQKRTSASLPAACTLGGRHGRQVERGNSSHDCESPPSLKP